MQNCSLGIKDVRCFAMVYVYVGCFGLILLLLEYMDINGIENSLTKFRDLVTSSGVRFIREIKK